ncbi:MAG: hypothetical protein A2075_08970 [Geobacteraceae bacterium GWC2_58_44]|nr:MAG: hypothetical protein A2075_08970 [Geobacteraceae bacterium GWC2_58_44]HBG04067.1 hypothetical protein [Geobacter sp.]
MKEIGTIVEVHGPVVHIRCDTLPPLQQALATQYGKSSYTFEVYQHLDREHLRAITLEHPAGLKGGMTVYDTGAPLRVPVSAGILGRLLNVFGAPLDGGSPLESTEFRTIHASPAPLHEPVAASGILETGIKVIDLLCPFVRGHPGGRS